MKRDSEKKLEIQKPLKKQSNFSSWILKDLEDTIRFGEHLIQSFPNIRILLLQGELGAGKTSLVKGIAKGIGITDPVTSPTFALAHHYRNEQFSLIHMDLYRLNDTKAANELFLQEEEELCNIKGIMIVEWPERLNLFLAEAWKVKLEYTNNEERIIQLFLPKAESRNP